MKVRKALSALGVRYRLHRKDLPGSPDIVMPGRRLALFVHGCFWHGHDCPLFRWPGSRQDFWRQKIGRNQERDVEVEVELDRAGWRVLKIWECSMKGTGRIGVEAVLPLAAGWLRSEAMAGEIRGTVRACG
jgi:DNA mismatch endonuclease (patch repair protein)